MGYSRTKHTAVICKGRNNHIHIHMTVYIYNSVRIYVGNTVPRYVNREMEETICIGL